MNLRGTQFPDQKVKDYLITQGWQIILKIDSWFQALDADIDLATDLRFTLAQHKFNLSAVRGGTDVLNWCKGKTWK
jgi:hypothetical protein